MLRGNRQVVHRVRKTQAQSVARELRVPLPTSDRPASVVVFAGSTPWRYTVYSRCRYTFRRLPLLHNCF